MKKNTFLSTFVCVVTSFSAYLSCTTKESKTWSSEDPNAFMIEGQLPVGRYDSACLYLVPMNGPHPRPVDSVFVMNDGKFCFEGNVEQMAVLRLASRIRYGIQELLVCTEPGYTRVVLDSVSSCIEGTPQNMQLQQWKELQQHYSLESQSAVQFRNSGVPEELYAQRVDSIRKALGEDMYQLLTGMGRSTASIFINKMRGGTLDSLRVAELNELLKDTVDWSLPQPGFRK